MQNKHMVIHFFLSVNVILTIHMGNGSHLWVLYFVHI
jgi:hypothetical protein